MKSTIQCPNTYQIRPANEQDIASMVAMLADLFALEEDFQADPAKQAHGLAMVLHSDSARICVAETSTSEIIGMCSGQLVVSTAEGAPSLWVEDVFIQNGFRNKGVASCLLEHLAEWARQQGAARMQLLADRTNQSGLAFYCKTGWLSTQLVCMRKKLS